MRQTLLLLLVAFLTLLFALQNAEAMQLRLLFWSVTVSKALMIIIVLLTGLLIGYFLQFSQQLKLKKEIHRLKTTLPSSHN
jgi:uncharacterized integral membrane protein